MRYPHLRDQRSAALLSVQQDLLIDVANIDDGTVKAHARGERSVLLALALNIDAELRFRNPRRRALSLKAPWLFEALQSEGPAHDDNEGKGNG